MRRNRFSSAFGCLRAPFGRDGRELPPRDGPELLERLGADAADGALAPLELLPPLAPLARATSRPTIVGAT
jgi:hypothetical protein